MPQDEAVEAQLKRIREALGVPRDPELIIKMVETYGEIVASRRVNEQLRRMIGDANTVKRILEGLLAEGS